MAERVMSPDMAFVKEVLRSGDGDLMKCYQCATCTVVCNPTPDERPFPRIEMLYAQWGFKDKPMSDPDICLCHPGWVQRPSTRVSESEQVSLEEMKKGGEAT